MAFIRTVRGDIPAEAFGVCYGHEHLLGRPPSERADVDFVLDSEAAALEELKTFREAGGRALVEMSTRDYHRNAAGLRRLSEQSGVHVVCATGYNKDTFSARLVGERSVEDLAAEFTREVAGGIGGWDVRAGVIKASSTLNAISPGAERVFRAAARAHHATGAPISTHTEAGTMGLEQVALLRSEGVDPRHIVIGHVDRRLDLDYHLALAEQGVFLSFDQISKEKYYPDRERAAFIARLVERGFGGQILLAGDLARRSYWPAYGAGDAPGFSYILRRFVPLLREAGLTEEAVTGMLVRNPARAFSFSILAPAEAAGAPSEPAIR